MSLNRTYQGKLPCDFSCLPGLFPGEELIPAWVGRCEQFPEVEFFSADFDAALDGIICLAEQLQEPVN